MKFSEFQPLLTKYGFSCHAKNKVQTAYHILNFTSNNFARHDWFHISKMVWETYGSKLVELAVYRDAIVRIVIWLPHISGTIRNIESITEQNYSKWNLEVFWNCSQHDLRIHTFPWRKSTEMVVGGILIFFNVFMDGYTVYHYVFD